jgi:sugar lactone lactonase YvrE
MRSNVAHTIWLPSVVVWLLLAAPANSADRSHPAPNFVPAMQSRIVPADAKVDLLWNEGRFTEGPVSTADGAILFSDIGNRILRYDPRSKQVDVFRDPSGKSNGLMFDARGRLVACEGGTPGGNRRVSITDQAGKVTALADSFQGKRLNSPNDLAITPGGNVYFTDPRYGGDEPRELDFEGVFVVDSPGEARVATREVEKPNGILVSVNGKTVYVSDNNNRPDGAHQLLAFRVQPDGTLRDKRVLFDFGPNRRGIDGMTLDEQGNLYASAGHGDEAGIYIFSPKGAPLAFVPTPGDPTNCVFGVDELARALFITAAGPKPQGNEPRPYALYRIDLNIPGYHLFPRVTP